MKHMWKRKLPTKVKVFMWLVFQDRVQSGEALKRMKWRRDARCVVTGLGWERVPNSLGVWLPLGGKDCNLKLLVKAILWSIWATRNKTGVIRWQQRGVVSQITG
jgi:hypothetical protein